MPTPQQILQQYWGYTSFKGEQEKIVQSVLDGKDTLALLPTGGGKSICFQVPAMIKDGLCLVVSPLIALMKDQVENLLKRNIPAIALYSGMSFFEVKNTLQQAAHGDYKFLYLSPERLETKLFKEFLPALNINFIAVDEAHCISQWGYDFRPPYMRIANLRDALHAVPLIALTASATALVQDDIVEKLRMDDADIYRQSFEKPNLSYSVFKVESKINKALDVLNNVQGSSIVYCRNRKETKRIAQLLQLQNISADFYHAGLSQFERSEKQTAWIQNKTRVIVCTNAFGMGIDKPDVRTVIHYNTPDCLENYYQEAGRAGRDGKKAYAVLLYQDIDEKELEALPNVKFPSIADIKKVYQSIADYLHIAVGLGEGNYYDFNLLDFCNNFKLDVFLVMNTLKMLEQEGHLSFTENIFLPSQVTFKADKSILNDIENVHPQLEEIVKALLRTYEGIYENKISINEKLIAKLNRVPYEKVYADLQSLHKYGIIEYLPQKETPQIYFLLNRAPAQHIHINHEAYFKRKDLYKKRVDAMLEYLKANKPCRSSFVSAYFGDDTVKPCGVCDNCLAKKGNEINEVEFKKIERFIYQAIPENGIAIKTLLQQLKVINKEKLWKVLDFLQSEKKLVVDALGNIKKVHN